jgi:hypothetical protein
MRVKFPPNDVIYTSEKQVLNNMTLALPMSF